jgi:hypothetical protein
VWESCVKGQNYQLSFLMILVCLWYILSAKAICVSWIRNLECTMFVVRYVCVIIRVSHDVLWLLLYCVYYASTYWLYYHNNVTNVIHFHFHNHFIVSWSSTCFGRQASIFRRHYTSRFWCELRAASIVYTVYLLFVLCIYCLYLTPDYLLLSCRTAG